MIFAVLDVLPGNVAEVMLGESATPESLKALNEKLGLNRPPLIRYAAWMNGLAHGDMGLSNAYGTPVVDLVAERAWVTVPLAVIAMLITTAIALTLGLYAASRHNRMGDVAVMVGSQIGIALPNFWFGILLSLVFAVQLRWFSAGGFPGWEDSQAPTLAIWPGLAIALSVLGLNLMGDGLRDLLDPKLARAR